MRAPIRRLISLPALCALAPMAFGIPGASSAAQAPSADEPADLYIRAARLIVRPGEVLEPGVVWIADGRIRAAASELSVPEGARLLEAPVVCAAFIDPWSALGITRDSLGDSGTSAASRTTDAIDVFGDDHLRREALKAGVTTARVQAGAWARVAGVGALVRLVPEGRREEVVLLADADVAATVGVTRQRTPGASAMDPFERIDELDKLVAALDKAQRYTIDRTEYRYELEEWEKKIAEQQKELEEGFKKAKKDREKGLEEAKEKDKEFKEKRYKEDRRPREPKFDEDSELLSRVVDGSVPLVIEAHRAAEIRGLLAGTEAFGRLRLVLAGGTEALPFAKTLASRGVKVLLWPAPAGDLVWDELEGHDLSLAGRLADAGVDVLLGSGGTDPAATRDLPLLAQLAVGHGLEREKAFEALTLGAARAFDAADRLGSVEAGKSADLLLLDGEPLVSTTRVLQVIAAGQVVVPAGQ